MSDTRRRVKVYTLNEDRQWDDRGTGHVSSTFVERLKGISLLVRAESDGEFLVSIAAFTLRYLALACYLLLVRTRGFQLMITCFYEAMAYNSNCLWQLKGFMLF